MLGLRMPRGRTGRVDAAMSGMRHPDPEDYWPEGYKPLFTLVDLSTRKEAMRSPDDIAADLENTRGCLPDHLRREAAEALRYLDWTEEERAKWAERADRAEAERDALIAYAISRLNADSGALIDLDEAFTALPEPVRKRIEAP